MVIGVDVGGTHMRTALIDFSGNIVRRQRTTTDISLGARHTARKLIAECRAQIDAAAELGAKVSGIGLGVAGKVDRNRRWVIFSPHLPAMMDYPLGPEIEAALNVPVLLENDANAFGIGENWVGAGRGISNWVGLTLGTGIGGCLILNGRLWTGDDLGFVAEIGHTIVHPQGPPCACGLRGCLETHASGTALVQFVDSAAKEGGLTGGLLHDLWRRGELNAGAIYQCSLEGDPVARQAFARMGWALGLAIANLLAVLGIRTAIIGGGVSAGWDQFIEPLRKSLAAHSSMLVADDAQILRSALGDDAALLGAARPALQRCVSALGS